MARYPSSPVQSLSLCRTRGCSACRLLTRRLAPPSATICSRRTQSSEEREDSAGNPVGVAVVANDRRVLETMRRVPWKSRDFELRGCFDNAPEAAKLIPALPVRIVLIEWELPGLCGVQCIQRLRAAQPSLGLMLVSEPPVERMLIERAVASGADLCWDARADIEHWLLVLELLAVLRGRRASGLSIGRNTSAAQTSLLTPREKRALLLLENGLLYKEIEERLNMKHSAFRKLQHRLYAKLRAANRMEAVRNAHRGNCGC